MVGRGAKRKGTKYFGPYSHAWAIRETVDQLLRVFPMRSCSNGVFKRPARSAGPACSATSTSARPLRGQHQRRGPPRDRRRLLRLHGRQHQRVRQAHPDRDVRRLRALDFEKAARLRDDLGALEKALEKQAVVFGDGTAPTSSRSPRTPSRWRCRSSTSAAAGSAASEGWVADRVDEGGTPELVEDFLLQLYGGAETDEIPREILVHSCRPTPGRSRRCSATCGGAGCDPGPQRGDKKSLQETVARNAGQALVMHKTKRAPTSRPATRPSRRSSRRSARRGAAAHRVLRHLQPPGHRGGRLDGGLRGRPGPQERVPPLRDQRTGPGAVGQNDVAHMHQVITRRFRRLLDEQARSTEVATDNGPMLVDPETGRPRKFAYAPGLVVVDGGPPQVAAAQRALDELGIDDIPVCGLAKRLEEVWLPATEDPSS